MSPSECEYWHLLADVTRMRAFEGTKGTPREQPLLDAITQLWDEHLTDAEQERIDEAFAAVARSDDTTQYGFALTRFGTGVLYGSALSFTSSAARKPPRAKPAALACIA